MNEQQRILIVDDEPQITRVLRRSLTTHGYEVRVASDGLAALQTFGDWPPDLVVTDLSMPSTDGLQLCRNLRAISQLPACLPAWKFAKRCTSRSRCCAADCRARAGSIRKTITSRCASSVTPMTAWRTRSPRCWSACGGAASRCASAG